MKPVNKLKISFDVQSIKSFLEGCDLFGEYTQRSDGETSPHKEMTDIWVRYKDPKPHIESGDWSEFMGCHESVWGIALIPVEQKLRKESLDGSRRPWPLRHVAAIHRFTLEWGTDHGPLNTSNLLVTGDV